MPVPFNAYFCLLNDAMRRDDGTETERHHFKFLFQSGCPLSPAEKNLLSLVNSKTLSNQLSTSGRHFEIRHVTDQNCEGKLKKDLKSPCESKKSQDGEQNTARFSGRRRVRHSKLHRSVVDV